MMTLQFLQILFILFHVTSARLKCDQPVNTSLYAHAAILSTGTWNNSINCYFVIKNASYKVPLPQQTRGNTTAGPPLYAIDLNKGRRICYQHQATLPIILTEDEQNFLDKVYADVAHLMLLGLERITSRDWIWDNLHGPRYKPPNWHKITEQATDTYTMMMTMDGRWIEHYPNRTWAKKHKFPVICHQRVYTLNDDPPGELGHWHPDAPKDPQSVAASMARMRSELQALERNGASKYGALGSVVVSAAMAMVV